MTSPSFTHAGSVVLRGSGDGTHVLLVRARLAPHDWVLPKGHLEPGETLEECARRETQEEAGVDARPVSFIGESRFVNSRGEPVVAAFFSMAYVADVPPLENRETCWIHHERVSTRLKLPMLVDLVHAALVQKKAADTRSE